MHCKSRPQSKDKSRQSMPLLAVATALSLSCAAFILQTSAYAADKSETTATSPVNWTELESYTTTIPRIFQGSDKRSNLLYELVFTNFAPTPATLLSIDVVDGDDKTKVIHSLKGEDLKQYLAAPNKASKANILGAGETKIAFINIAADKASDIPKNLLHRIRFHISSKAKGKTTVEQRELFLSPLAVSAEGPLVISPPLRGDRWLAVGGYASMIGHRRSIFPIDNRLRCAQRFAIDWVQISDDGYTTKSDVKQMENATCFKKTVHAVKDGTVVGVVNKWDSQPYGVPSGDKYYPGGNTMTIKHDNGYYSFYAHLLKDSMKVKEGDRVKAGDEIALLGNSGNSTGPHLHFHMTAGPGTLGADGIPYVFDKFTLVGKTSDMDTCLKNDSLGKQQSVVTSRPDIDTAGQHSNELVKEGHVVNF